MREGSCVLMVSGDMGTHVALRKVLSATGIRVRLARTCAEASAILEKFSTPAALFSDATLPDGTWADIMELAGAGSRQVPVIVVSRVVDINLYINALEKGASDFIVPPFCHQDISHVLKCAMQANVGLQPASAAWS
jgi:DNA-binding NtrC family response regulator